MRPFALCCGVVVGMAMAASGAQALTLHTSDMCAAPKMKTEKWQLRSEVGGMTLLLPPGFTAGGHSYYLETADSHFYQSGEHRSIAVGSGRGPAFVGHNSSISEESECETVIADRRVNITKYRWVIEDPTLSASGQAGSRFLVVARFYAQGEMREVYVSFESNSPSDFNFYRGLFWTVSFEGARPSTVAAAATPATLGAPAPTAAAEAPSAAAAPPAAVSQAACAAPALPSTDAVLDSSVVRMLIATGTPIPRGYEVLALQFSGTGELSGMSIEQSDLPQASQHELSSVIATNLKSHDVHDPSTFLLRIDSSDSGLRYAVLPLSACGK
jgi:hypothetical protein